MNDTHLQDESGDKKYFTIIPNYVLNHSTLWDREVYIQMKRIAGEHGTCWTSREALAKQCGMSVGRFNKSIKYLLDHKWIEFVGKKKVDTKGGNQNVNEYRICDLWNINNTFYQKNKTPKGGHHKTPLNTKGGSRIKPKGGHQVTPNKNPINNNQYTENKFSEFEISFEREKEKTKKDVKALIVREKLYDIFEKEMGVRPTQNSGDYYRVLDALKRLKESDVIDLVDTRVGSGKVRTVREALTHRSVDIYLQDNY